MNRRDDVIRVGCPYFSDSDIVEITSQIASVLRSGWLTSGKFVAKFEQKFSKIIGTKYAIALNSGTAALHTIISLLNLNSDEEIIVPANTFASTANAVLYVGAKPIFADCDIEAFNITAETIEQRISHKTRALIITHIGGNPCEMDEITKLCNEKGIILIEDAAHAHGSKYRGRNCGSFGKANAFSFYPTKVITSGEGGMITTNSEEVYKFAILFRNVGRAGIGHGPIVTLGYNYRMSDIHAVLGLNQLKHLEEFVKKRNELARIYNEELSKINWVEPQLVNNHSVSSYYAYIIRLLPNAPISRDALMDRLRKNGIETTIMFRPVYLQPFYKEKFGIKDRCPNAEVIGDTSLVLPLHAGMNITDVEHIVKVIKNMR